MLSTCDCAGGVINSISLSSVVALSIVWLGKTDCLSLLKYRYYIYIDL